jgi:hypothetical protein
MGSVKTVLQASGLFIPPELASPHSDIHVNLRSYPEGRPRWGPRGSAAAIEPAERTHACSRRLLSNRAITSFLNRVFLS